MPYKSDAQRKYFNANKAAMAKAGVNVTEWNNASAGLKLPARVKPVKGKKPVKVTPLSKLLGLKG
jgi:hypothetical protein